MIHMVHQIQASGPCYLHEMWSYERFMSVLSRYVHNQAYPEGSMIEGYSNKEVVECSQEYLKVHKGINSILVTRVGWLGRVPVVEKCSSTMITKR